MVDSVKYSPLGDPPRDAITYPAVPLSSVHRQTTRPPYLSGYNGVLTIVPRRGWDQRTSLFLSEVAQNPISALGQWSMSAPLRLLLSLADIHPMVQSARSVWLNLPFGEEDTKFIAVDDDDNENTAGTKAIADLVDSLPLSVGGIVGLQKALGEQALFLGLCCLECVPTADNTALTDLVTFDPLTIRFRDDGNGDRFEEQIQRSGWRSLNPYTCLCVPFDGNRDNPYGRPVFSAALAEALADISRNSNVNDVLKAVAYPHISVGFPWQETMEFALEHPELLVGARADGGDLSAGEFATQEFNNLVAKLGLMKADDIIVYPKDGNIGVINAAAGLPGVATILDVQRHRLTMSLDTLPTLLGITQGGTLAYSSVDWAMQVRKIQGFRSFINNGIVCRAFDLHLRLMGIPCKTKAECVPIRASDELLDEQARQLRITNEQALIDAGYQTRETASIGLTGSAPVVDDVAFEGQRKAKMQEQVDQAVAMKPQTTSQNASGESL